jgi:hypothetical protein
MTKRTRYFLMGSGAFLAVSMTVGLAAYYGGSPGFAQPAGPEELNFVPKDAVVVAYANVRQLMDSQFRQQVKALDPAERAHGQEEFRAATGINIETDIDYIVASVLPAPVATPGAEPKNACVLARGRFDQAKIEAFVREKGGIEETYRDKRLFLHPKPMAVSPAGGDIEGMAITFVDPKVVAIGTPEALKRVIDLQFGAPNVRANEEVMKMVQGVDNGNAWAVARFDSLTKQAHLPEQVASQLPPLTWVCASGHVNGGVSGTISVEARDEEAAKNLHQVVAGFLALGKLQAGSKPELNAALQSINLQSSGTTVSVSFTVPSAVIEALKTAAAPKPPTVPEVPKPPTPPAPTK